MRLKAETSLRRLATTLIGEKVWWVAGGAGASFSLALGGGFPRSRPVKSRDKWFSLNQPEHSVIVWSAWRLDGCRAPLASSDGEGQRSVRVLRRAVVGTRIREIELARPCWDLRIAFSRALWLTIFCDHIGRDPSIDGNWQLRVGSRIAAVGPGTRIRLSVAHHLHGPALRLPRRSRA